MYLSILFLKVRGSADPLRPIRKHVFTAALSSGSSKKAKSGIYLHFISFGDRMLAHNKDKTVQMGF